MDIVVHPPLFELSASVLNRPEQMGVEAFISEPPVEAILRWSAGSNEFELTPLR